MQFRFRTIACLTVVFAGAVLVWVYNTLASAQVLITYITTVGTPVTSQTSGLRRVRHSHTVTPSSVSAASN